MKRPMFRMSARYFAVSLFCALLHNFIMIGADAIGVYYGASVLISALVLIPTGFFLQSVYTFEAKRNWRSFRRYASIMLMNMPGSYLGIWLLYDRLGIAMVIAAPATTFLLFVWNFFASGWALQAAGSSPSATRRAR